MGAWRNFWVEKNSILHQKKKANREAVTFPSMWCPTDISCTSPINPITGLPLLWLHQLLHLVWSEQPAGLAPVMTKLLYFLGQA